MSDRYTDAEDEASAAIRSPTGTQDERTDELQDPLILLRKALSDIDEDRHAVAACHVQHAIDLLSRQSGLIMQA